MKLGTETAASSNARQDGRCVTAIKECKGAAEVKQRAHSSSMPLFSVTENLPKAMTHGDTVQQSETVAASNDEWLKVGRSYRHQSTASEQQSVPTEITGLTDGARVQSPPNLRARQPRASDFFEHSKASPLRDKESENAASGDFGEVVKGDGRHASGSTQSKPGKGRKSRGDEGTKKRKRQKQPSTFPSDHTSSSSDASPQHRKKGGKRDHHKGSRDRRKYHSSDRKSKGARSTSRRHKSSRNASESSSRDNRSSRRSMSPTSTNDHIFVEERRGDPNNLTFGGFYRLDVPLYHSMNREVRLPQNRGSRKAVRYFGNQSRRLDDDGHVSRIQLWKGQKRRDQALVWAQASASSTESSVQAKPSGHLLIGQGSESNRPRESPDFLPVDPTIVLHIQKPGSDDSQRDDNDSKVPMESLEQWVTRRTKEFNRATREQPGSEDLWLQYADFQEEAVRAVHGSTSFQTPSAAMLRMALEKRMSVVEGALRRNRSSIMLRVEQLHLAEQLQEHAVVDSLWKKALDKTDHSRTVWARYFKFKAGHFASFSASNQRDWYSNSIRALESRGEEAREAHEKGERAKGVFIVGRSMLMLTGCKEALDAEASMLDVLWSYCVSERAAGYEERAFGALQAMAELNIRSHSCTVSMADLERYWNSEFPRIGDAHPSQAGISGWLQGQDAPNARTRPALTNRPLGLRIQRKRAVDFFSGDSPVHTKDSTDTSLSGRVGVGHGVEQRVGQQTKTSSRDVLETAYRAAVAMSASAQIETAAPPEDRAVTNDTQTERRTSSDLKPRTVQKESTSSARAFKQPFSPRLDTEGSPKAVQPVTKSGPMSERNTGAVDAEGLIWVDESQGTAYSVRHGYRIDVQDALDSVSGLEYGRILSQMQHGDAPEAHKRQRSRRERTREAEWLKEAAVLEDVPHGDRFCAWADAEDEMTQREWQPLRASVDPEGAEEQPDRVVFVEDLKPLLFRLSQPCSLRILMGMLLSVGGLVFPRSSCSHSSKALSEAANASSFGCGGASISLLASVENGLQAVWKASNSDVLASGGGVTASIGRPGACLSALAVNSAADQYLLLTDQAIGDPSRQFFLRNVLHHLIRTPESLVSDDVGYKTSSTSALCMQATDEDTLVQLQCTLMLFEGWLTAAAPAPAAPASGRAGRDSTDDELNRGRDARKVAKSLLEASQASATDLRLWCAYVQVLALLDCREEAIKVAEKALSMVETLPEDKKPQSAELFWLAFRLQARLPLSPRDAFVGVDSSPTGNVAVGELFCEGDGAVGGSREMTLHILCSFAEGRFTRTKLKKSKRNGKGSRLDTAETVQVTPPRLMAARRLMIAHVARIAANLRQVANGDAPHQPGDALDMTPPLMYYSAAWVWLEYLTRGPAQAEQAMSDSLSAADLGVEIMQARASGGSSAGDIESTRIGGSLAGNQPYSWKVLPQGAALGVCLERMHRAFCEVLVLAQRHNAAATGPSRVRAALLRGLQSFPSEPGMLAMLLDAEKLSGSQQRLVHHLSEVSRRRALTWEPGPTGLEWVLAATHQVMRCVSETRQATMLAESGEKRNGQGGDEALRVKNWPDGSYARLKRSMETAVTHPTGRGMPLLWRMYMSLEAIRGHHTQAKHLFWRAIHACPGSKAVWLDAFRGNDREKMGIEGLRPAFRERELHEVVDALLEKSLHLRVEPP